MRNGLPLCVLAASAVLAACAKPDSATVEAIGTLEVVEVDVSPISAGRVSRVLVDEGAAVRAGDTLAVLTTPTLPSDVAQRQAREASANAALQEATRGPRTEEIASAAAELASAEAALDRANKDVERLRPLAAKQNVSAQDFDAVRATAASALGHRDALKAQLKLLQEGTRPERLHAAEADERGARASVASALATAGDLVLLSPVTGTVIARSTEPGEIVLPRLKVGQHVNATLDAYPAHKFEGRVVAISTVAEYTPRVALTEKERSDLLFGVKVEFSDTTGMLKAGLPITVRIDAPLPTANP